MKHPVATDFGTSRQAHNIVPERFQAVSGASRLHGLAALLDASTCRARGEGVALDAGLRTLMRLWAAQRTAHRAVYWTGNDGSAALCARLGDPLTLPLVLDATGATIVYQSERRGP